MATKTETVQKVVKFLIIEKKVIKFEDDSTQYSLSDKVASYDLAKFGIKPGILVDVAIEGSQVVYLRKAEQQESPKQETKNTEVKFEESDNAKSFRWTVSGIPASKEVISFKESTTTKWYLVPKELADQFEKLGVKARVVVDVTLGTMEAKGEQKPSIKTITVVESDKTEVTKTDDLTKETVKDEKKSFSNFKNDSIECQCALKNAGSIVAALIEYGSESVNTVDKIESVMLRLAEASIKFIQK